MVKIEEKSPKNPKQKDLKNKQGRMRNLKVIKKVSAVIPIMVAVILLYGIFSGNIEDWIHQIKSTKSTNDSAGNTYPIGVIENYRTTFKWENSGEPYAEVYAPDNKIGKPYLYYGVSVDECNWLESCYDEDVEYNKSHKLSEKYLGANKYNPDKVVNVGEKFTRKYMCSECTINKIDTVESLLDCESRYYLSDGRLGILPGLNERGVLENMVIQDISGQNIQNQNLIFLNIQITVESKSEWVQEVMMIPKLKFLNIDNDVLIESNNICYCICSGNDRSVNYSYTGYPIYSDLGYFDSTLPDCEYIDEFHYPMRKGESVTYNVIYPIPEEYIDNAYLVFDDMGHQEEFTYNFTDITIVKVK